MDVESGALDDMKEHGEAHGKHREPFLDGISSSYDLNLFREAQSKACEDKVNSYPSINCSSVVV